MRLTTRGIYAVTAVLDVALHQSEGVVALADIAKRQNIAQSYLGQLFMQLRRYDLVQSKRGPGGGYRLARDAEQISIFEIIEAVGERVKAIRCRGRAECEGGEKCLSHHLWERVGRQMNHFLSNISIAEVISDSFVKTVAQQQYNQWSQTIPNSAATNRH